MSNVHVKAGITRQLPGGTTTGAKTGEYKDSPYTTYQITVAGTGAVSATVLIEVSNDGTNWCSTPLGTVSISGTTSATDGFATNASWKWHRANISAISGTGATVTVNYTVS
jgi:hypothetical protein